MLKWMLDYSELWKKCQDEVAAGNIIYIVGRRKCSKIQAVTIHPSNSSMSRGSPYMGAPL